MLSPERLARRHAVLGLLVLVVVAGVSALAISRPDPLADPQRVWVVFDDATGISIIQRDVRIAGVRVGTIGEVRRVGDDAEVELIFDRPVGEIHADAEAHLRPHTPFEGTAYVDLDPGSASAPALGEDPIPKSQTRIYVPLDQAQRVFNRPNRANLRTVLPEVSAGLDSGGAAALRELLREAPELLRDAGPAARALRGENATELRSAIAAMNETLAVSVDENPDLRRTIADVRQTIAAVAVDEGRPVDEILARLPRALEQMPRLAAQGERSLTQISELSRTVEPALPDVGRTVRGARPVVRRSASVLPDSAQALRNTTEVLRAAVLLEPTLREAFMSLGRTGTRLDQSVTPALKEETVLGLPVYMQLLAGFAGSTSQLSGFRTKEQSPLGFGHGLRGTTDYFVPTQGDEKDIP